jgi:hypothetical protein
VVGCRMFGICGGREYRVIKKSLCTLWLQYKNTQKYFKQFQSLTVITYLELGITDGISVSLVSINVWSLAGDTLNITCDFLYCNHQVHRDFLITRYLTCYALSFCYASLGAVC